MFTGTAKDRGRLAHHMNWARIFEEGVRGMIEGDESSRGDGPETGTYLWEYDQWRRERVGYEPLPGICFGDRAPD